MFLTVGPSAHKLTMTAPSLPMTAPSLQDNLHALQDDTMSQESDVLINLDTTKCRALPPGTSSVRVALSFDEDDTKEQTAENTSTGATLFSI